MATISQWQNDLSTLTGEELAEIDKALETLRHWHLFNKEYKELAIIQTMVSQELLVTMINPKRR